MRKSVLHSLFLHLPFQPGSEIVFHEALLSSESWPVVFPEASPCCWGIGIASLPNEIEPQSFYLKDNKDNEAHMFRRALPALQTGKAENEKSDISHRSV